MMVVRAALEAEAQSLETWARKIERLLIREDVSRAEIARFNHCELEDRAKRLRLLAAAPLPEVGVYVGGGLVQYARSSVPVSMYVVDVDGIDECCAGGLAGPCSPDEPEEDQDNHAWTREALGRLDMMPEVAL